MTCTGTILPVVETGIERQLISLCRLFFFLIRVEGENCGVLGVILYDPCSVDSIWNISEPVRSLFIVSIILALAALLSLSQDIHSKFHSYSLLKEEGVRFPLEPCLCYFWVGCCLFVSLFCYRSYLFWCGTWLCGGFSNYDAADMFVAASLKQHRIMNTLYGH